MISAYESGASRRPWRSIWIAVGLLCLCTLLGLGLRKTNSHFGYRSSRILDDVRNSTLGFQKIFVVSLPSRYDHRDAVSLAASLTGLKIEYVSGATEVDRKFLPPGGTERNLPAGALGCWRAHLDLLRMIVDNDISSALIMEDDADWDLRIKGQMRDFARASQLLLQPKAGTTDQFLDASYPVPDQDQEAQTFNIHTDSVTPATTSPYGDLDRWDLLWLGHCGTRFARASDLTVPLGRVMLPNDPSVPEAQHLNMQFGNSELMDDYPPHTRIVHHPWQAVCSTAYAISHRGARRMLYEAGIKSMIDPVDIMYQYVCNGVGNRSTASCVAPLPQLFQQHRPKGRTSTHSDIETKGDSYNVQSFTRNIRWSTRLNFEQLLKGSKDYVDLFPDGGDPPKLVGL